MTKQFINPNFHVILIHYPLGVFVLGVALELFGFLWRRSSVRLAARWMILLGGLSSLIVATSGIYALADLKSARSDRYHYLKMHVLLTSIASLVAVLTVVFGLAASDRWRRKLYAPMLILLVAAWGLFASGAWWAGESVYTQGTGVVPEKHVKAKHADEPTEPAGTQPVSEPAPRAPADSRTTAEKVLAQVHFFAGPTIQLHMISAGAAFALAFGALGLSIRKITSLYPDEPVLIVPADDAFTTPALSRSNTEAADMVRSLSPMPEFAPPVVIIERQLPTATWWLLAALVALSTSLLGYWIWAEDQGTWSLREFWENFLYVKGHLVWSRSSLHIWLGSSIIIMSLVLAMLARWGWRSALPLAIVSILLVLVIAAQVWLGILLQFDGQEGPINNFNPKDESPTARQVNDAHPVEPQRSIAFA